MYWTTLSLLMGAESFFYPIISWFPFYSWIRFGVHLYLVLPGQQGSIYIYRQHIHPWLEQHEREIDHFISESHDKAKKAGLSYMQQGIEYVKVNVLGMPPSQPAPPPPRNSTYSQNLLSRFNMPSARAGLATAGATDIFSMLGTAMQQATYPTSRSRDAQAEDLTASGSLVPPNLSSEERSEFIATQRDRLRVLLQAFDKEAYEQEPGSNMQYGSSHANASGASLHPRQLSGSLSRNRSEGDFEHLAYEELPEGQHRPSQGQSQAAQGKQSGWGQWIWGNYGERDSAILAKKQD